MYSFQHAKCQTNEKRSPTFYGTEYHVFGINSLLNVKNVKECITGYTFHGYLSLLADLGEKMEQLSDTWFANTDKLPASWLAKRAQLYMFFSRDIWVIEENLIFLF